MRCFLLIIERFQLFSYYLREVVIPILFSKILLYLPVDVAQLSEPRKFLCVSFLILSYPFVFCLVRFACQYPNSGIRAFLVGVVNTQKLFVYTVTIHVYDTIHPYGTVHYVTVGVYRKSVR